MKIRLQNFLAPLFNSVYLDFSLFHFNYYNFTITYGLGHAFDLFVVITVRDKKKRQHEILLLNSRSRFFSVPNSMLFSSMFNLEHLEFKLMLWSFEIG